MEPSSINGEADDRKARTERGRRGVCPKTQRLRTLKKACFSQMSEVDSEEVDSWTVRAAGGTC